MLQDGDLSGCRCLVIDQNMPRMTGLELLQALRRKGIGIPAILMSAHATPTLRRLASDAGIALIEKPLPGNKLVEFIRAAIDGKSS